MASDKEEVAILVEGAKTFPDNMLISMFIENMDRAIEINNSGLFKVASILADEMDRRGLSTPELRTYNELIKRAVAEAEKTRCDSC